MLCIEESQSRFHESRDTAFGRTQYTYDPFGGTSATGTSSSNPSQYTGRENDGTGLYYNRARYYSPTLQRFISEDPIGVLGGVNVYAYAANNPISFADPSGLDSVGNFFGGLIKAIHPFAHIPGDHPWWAPLGGTPLDFDIPWDVNPHSCWFKAGFYAGVGLMIVAAVADPLLAPEEADAFAAGTESRAARAAEREAGAAPNAGDRRLPFSDPERTGGVNDAIDGIDQGGPYSYAQDDTVFRNREGRLPQQPDGYYREYTVDTPGASGRAKRRIVQGRGGETYYSDDHYKSFVRIDARRHP